MFRRRCRSQPFHWCNDLSAQILRAVSNRVVDPRNEMVPSCPSWVPHQMAQPVTDWHLSWWPHDKKRRSWALPAAAARCLRTFGLDSEIPRNLRIRELFNTVRDVSRSLSSKIERKPREAADGRKLPMELNLFLVQRTSVHNDLLVSWSWANPRYPPITWCVCVSILCN